MFDDLLERAVLVVGAGSEIGQALALGFGEAGARLAVTDADRAAAEETARLVNVLGGQAIAVAGAHAARDALGGLDVVVAAFGDEGFAHVPLELLAESGAGSLVLVAPPGSDPSATVDELAQEAMATGIRVNGVVPLAEGTTAPLGRAIRGDDVVGAALYLASAVGSFVTGTVLIVDGGARFAVP